MRKYPLLFRPHTFCHQYLQGLGSVHYFQILEIPWNTKNLDIEADIKCKYTINNEQQGWFNINGLKHLSEN